MKNMKRILVFGAAFTALALALTGCSAQTSNDGAANDENKTFEVGVVQLVQHPALDAATQGFQEKLTELLEADGYGVNFDVQNASGDSATCATIANGFVSDNKDLIMANATAALQAASAATADIPVLGTSVTDYATALDMTNWSGKTGINVSGTSDLAPLDLQAQMIKELVPDAKTVGILYSSAEANSKYQSDVVVKELTYLGFEVKIYTSADTNDIASVTQSAVDECDVIYIPTDNTIAASVTTVDEIASKAKTPIIAGEAGIASGCGVATLSIDYSDLGARTALMAYEILVNGANPADMDVEFAEATTKQYVAHRAEMLGVKIPEGYEAIKDAE